MNNYITTVHIRCPFNPVWDYYEVQVSTLGFLKCEDFEDACDHIRGDELTQEDTAIQICNRLRWVFKSEEFTVRVSGRHGANCKLVCERSSKE